jgi:hypothetical protein
LAAKIIALTLNPSPPSTGSGTGERDFESGSPSPKFGRSDALSLSKRCTELAEVGLGDEGKDWQKQTNVQEVY